jgi:hypothetical protein
MQPWLRFWGAVAQYRVAAIFPEQFQSFTDAIKNHIFFKKYFAQNDLSYLP